ncbi:hypothetical protein BJ322DRAFT_164946 [Thelephora terrestris]|uniref:Uncharacterized protein n=1 Tax=Thelephora terrestris TaxID=56493 RepID=A0A9P6H9T8_9AGAM|nr:hypothetical protein BJ322DRAFT_164946 [Thelephora terrestris]
MKTLTFHMHWIKPPDALRVAVPELEPFQYESQSYERLLPALFWCAFRFIWGDHDWSGNRPSAGVHWNYAEVSGVYVLHLACGLWLVGVTRPTIGEPLSCVDEGRQFTKTLLMATTFPLILGVTLARLEHYEFFPGENPVGNWVRMVGSMKNGFLSSSSWNPADF